MKVQFGHVAEAVDCLELTAPTAILGSGDGGLPDNVLASW